MEKVSQNREKFVRLAEIRTQAALNAIRKIGNLSNKGTYEYETDDIKKILKALRDATAEVERKFDSSTNTNANKFSLLT